MNIDWIKNLMQNVDKHRCIEFINGISKIGYLPMISEKVESFAIKLHKTLTNYNYNYNNNNFR